MLSSRCAGIPISSSTIDGPGVPQLMNRGEQTLRAVTGSGGRLHFGMVAGIKSERWPTSNRNPWPDCVGIRTFLSKGNNSILGHGVTLLLGGSGGLITNPVTPPSSHRHPVHRIAPA